MAKPPALPAEALNEIEVESELMELALDMVAEGTRKVDAFTVSMEACGEFYGIKTDEEVSAEHMLVLAALASRLVAFADLLESPNLAVRLKEPDEDTRLALIDAACSAKLVTTEGKPAFQLLDFLGRVSAGGRP